MTMIDIHGIQPGWEVFDATGAKIGDVVSMGPNYIHIKTGGLFSKDFYVPATAISDVEEHRVELSVPKAEVTSQGWDKAPAETVSSGTGGGADPNE